MKIKKTGVIYPGMGTDSKRITSADLPVLSVVNIGATAQDCFDNFLVHLDSIAS